MRLDSRSATLLLAGLAATATAPGPARADVTIQENTTFDLAIIKAHGSSTEYTTSDKQRRDTEFHCEGFMSLLCGNAQSGEIVRLDRDLKWELEPKKKEYRETAFPTAAQIQAAKQQAEAMLEKLKQCPAMQNTAPAPDTSKCEMSPPKFDVKQTGMHATLAGHDTQLTQVALTQSCTNRQTGDVCDFVFAFDNWLTQDAIAGVDEHKAFQVAYLKKMGFDELSQPMMKTMKQFLTPYADAMKQLGSKAEALKGYPLKTTMRIAFGGEHCAAAKNQAQSAGSGGGSVVGEASQAAGAAAAGSAAGVAGASAGAAAGNAVGNSAVGSILGSGASAFGSKLVSGMFQKKKAEAAAAKPAPSTTPGSTLAPGMVQAAEITVETTSIGTGAVPGSESRIPTGWKLLVPRPEKAQKEFTCPKAGPGG